MNAATQREIVLDRIILAANSVTDAIGNHGEALNAMGQTKLRAAIKCLREAEEAIRTHHRSVK